MKRIKYISKFNKEMTVNEINQLTEKSRKNNAEKDITGILMTSGQVFFQIIEGPEKAINDLWDDIISDFRHTDIILLKSENGSFDRLFPDWSMKGIALDAESELRLEPLKAIMEMIVEWEKRKDKLVNTLELSILSEMRRIEDMTN
jgi:hypothetical protein